jgi:HemY protein
MRFLFAALLVLAATIGLTLVAQRDPGYVLLSYSGWSVETSLGLFLAALAIAFALLYFTIRLLAGTFHLPLRLGGWQRRRHAARARRRTNRGLIALAEGNWPRAERDLSRAAKTSDTPLINYLGAARAAQKQDAEDRRDQYLSQAYESMPDAELAVGLTQADVQLSQGQLEQALATLRHLRGIAPKHTYVLYLLKKLYEKLESWDDLHDLLPELRRHHILNPSELEALEHRVCRMRLTLAGDSLESLQQYWETLPKALRHTPDLVHDYAARLIPLNAEQQAEEILREALKKQWDPQLVRLYGQVRGADLNLQLTTAEHGLKEHENHPELLLALSRLCLHNQLWGKARSYLEASLGMEQRAETYCELGNLLQQMGETEKAAQHFRMGLELACSEHCTEFTVPTNGHFHPPSHPELDKGAPVAPLSS